MEKLILKQDTKYKKTAPLSKTITNYSLLISMILLSSCSGKEVAKIENIHELCVNNTIGSFCNKSIFSWEWIIPITSIRFKEKELEIKDIWISDLLIPLEGVCEKKYENWKNIKDAQKKYNECLNNTTISYDWIVVKNDSLKDIPKEKQNFLLIQLKTLIERLDFLKFLIKNK